MDLKDIPAFFAALVGLFLFVPQLRLAWRGRGHVAWGTAGLSLVMSASWITYGILNGLAPVVVSNTVLLTMMVCVVTLQKTRGRAAPSRPSQDASPSQAKGSSNAVVINVKEMG